MPCTRNLYKQVYSGWPWFDFISTSISLKLLLLSSVTSTSNIWRGSPLTASYSYSPNFTGSLSNSAIKPYTTKTQGAESILPLGDNERDMCSTENLRGMIGDESEIRSLPSEPLKAQHCPGSTPGWIAFLGDVEDIAKGHNEPKFNQPPNIVYVPERSTYVLATNLAMIALFVFWQPIGYPVWTATNSIAITLIYVLFFAGWALVFISTCWLNHFDIFGLRQVWLYFNDKEYVTLKFEMPGLYRYIRHPLYVGWFVVFWATPTMTAGHLFFALFVLLVFLPNNPHPKRLKFEFYSCFYLKNPP